MSPDWENSSVKRPSRRSRRKCARNSISTSGSSSTTRISRFTPTPCLANRGGPARKNDPKLGVHTGLGVDIDRPAMLLDDDIVADGKAKPGALPGSLVCEKRVEQLLLHRGRNAGAVVADPDFHLIAKAAGRGRKGWLIAIISGLGFPLGRGIKAIGDEV